MTFVSYAQNFEDVLLWRALQQVGDGFYIDVGAADPEEGSVTRAFYERGWRGVNIEPEPDFAAALRAERPRDINLEAVAGSTPGRTTIHRIAGTGLSTTHADIATAHGQRGFATTEQRAVEVVTLADVWRANKLETVHFLKIDAEGAERDVLLGADLQNLRPWILVIEATAPLSPQQVTDTFEDLVLGAGYRRHWFDGVNAWYIASEHEDRLGKALDRPPNAFDDFVVSSYVAQLRRADAAEARLAETHAKLERDHARILELETAWHHQQREAAASHESLSGMREAQRANEARIAELDASWHQQVFRAESDGTRVLELEAALDASLRQQVLRAESAGARVLALETALDASRARHDSLEASLQEQQHRADTAEGVVAALQGRWSYRIARPLRAVGDWMTRALHGTER